MSAFITNEDYEQYIDKDVLGDVIDTNPDIRERAEAIAESLVADHLNSRYDTAAIFAATGDDRHHSVIWAVVNLALYHIHQRLHPNAVPEHRLDAKDEVKAWLRGVSCAQINPVGLPTPAGEDKDYILYGGETKRQDRMI